MKTVQKVIALLVTALIVISYEKKTVINPGGSGDNTGLNYKCNVLASKQAGKAFIIKTRRASPVYSRNETHQLSQKQRPCKQIGHIYAMKLAMLYWLLKRH